MGWTYHEYDEQPTFFLSQLSALMQAEAEAAKGKSG